MESSIVSQADVYWNDQLAGTITQTQRESTFRYGDFGQTGLAGGGVAFNLSRVSPYYSVLGTSQHTFFANLLPEGYRLQAVRSRLRASGDDALSILLEVGADCVGNVSVVMSGNKPGHSSPEFQADDVKVLDLRQLLTKDLTRNASMPGVQEKISDYMISYPAKIGSTAAFVKLDPPNYPRLVVNEGFFMRMGADCGLITAETQLVSDKLGGQALMVRRFDRTEAGKLHQEDACQMLDIYPGSKYSVSMRDVAIAVATFGTGGPTQLRRLLELVAFSYLIGNGDLHAKNISVLQSPKGMIELSPAYDLLSTLPYKGLDQRMALKMDGKDEGWKRRFVVTFFSSLGLPKKASESVLDRLCDKCLPWIARLGEIGYDRKVTAHLSREISRRRDDLGSSASTV